MTEAQKALRLVLRVDFPPADRLGHGKMELLALIRDTGSISAAGRAMDMSYRRAWLLVDAMNRMFSQPVIESQRGGKQGGGAMLSPFGLELLERYEGMQKRAALALADDLAWLEANRNTGDR